MDPDLVRQQEEAEREALAALAKNPDALLARRVPEIEAQTGQVSSELSSIQRLASEAPAAPAKHPWAIRFLHRLGRFLSFGLAVAILGSPRVTPL